ncbi:MAG: MotA/TolQ/ExbB proton channel family protein [Planctomycetota bacterium]|nr:MotA/TolQ/ExbB proton channel family protein [Planctomycetota bacterium]MEC8735215.1 MotA/TolQ/ExbB proton channel family protein [Planctomycetota bacterium]MEC9158004.1 MotA/TolQ/ExbB proton channel family protein [Planctomycetota bacterium]MEC9234555.1 MotA/TolQ/ExbB proton channel family protein [Planctomycetota bacterium]
MNHLQTLIVSAAPAGGSGSTLLKFITDGGVIGYLLILLSVIALVLVVVHAIQIRRSQLIPEDQIEDLQELLARGASQQALDYCLEPANDSFLTRVLAPGLTRFLGSPFGAFEIKTAIEDAGSEQTERLYRSTDALGVIGAIAPLLGLLGTVYGMISAFSTIGSGGGGPTNHEQLAANISLALVTTMQGLVVAIPCVILYSFFRNRIDAIAADAGSRLDSLTMLLESSRAPVPDAGNGPANPGNGAGR